MLEISSTVFIDKRNGSTIFQLNMKKDGRASSATVDYGKLLDKNVAEYELSNMIVQLCDIIYTSGEHKNS